jgi:hypothetical protein
MRLWVRNAVSAFPTASTSALCASTADTWLWLNVLTQHVAAPPPPPPKPQGRWGRLKAFFWHAMEIEGGAEIQKGQAELAMGQAVDVAVERHIWLPVHEFLLRHKLLADGVGVALDVVGVVAGGVFIVAAAPEILGGAAAIGALGLVTGLSAATGSAILLGIDGTIFGLEVAGLRGRAETLENNKTIQWMRIAATVMLLPDVAVGGVRALGEIGQISNEGREAATAAAEAGRQADVARARVAKIVNPSRHPGPLNRRMHKVAAFERAAETQAKAAQAAHDRIRMTALRDIGIVPGSSIGSTGLLAGAPPSLALSPGQRERDEQTRRTLVPAGGMPKDVKMELRVSSHEKVDAP